MNLAAFQTTPIPTERTPEWHAVLRKAQHSAMDIFYDRLKQSNGVEWAETNLDKSLKVTAFNEELNWLLEIWFRLGSHLDRPSLSHLK